MAPPASPGAQAAASPPRSPPGAPPAADAAAEVQAPEPDSDDGEAEEPEEGEAIEASLGEGWFRGAAGRLAGMGSRSLEEQVSCQLGQFISFVGFFLAAWTPSLASGPFLLQNTRPSSVSV